MEEKLKSMTEIIVSVNDVIALSYVLQVLHGLEGMSQGKMEVKVVRNDFEEQEVEAKEELETSANAKQEAEGAQQVVTVAPQSVPDEMACLKEPKSLRLLESLHGMRLLDDDFRPVKSLSWAKRGYLAYRLAMQLDIVEVWKVFGRFWGMSSEALRSGYNRAKDQESTMRLEKKLKNLL